MSAEPDPPAPTPTNAQGLPPAKAEVLFYHLERLPLEKVLPPLVEKSLQRGWRAVVQVGSDERLDVLDNALWSYSDDSFLPHGTARDGEAQRQPVFLTTDASNPNGAQIRFFVEGAEIGNLMGYVRVVLLFDGQDSEAIAIARQQWKIIKAAGHAVTYWQQNARGGWEKKA